METLKLIAIDPWDCGCTECITGEYVALRFATDDNMADLIAGRLRSNLNSGTELEISTTYTTDNGKLTPGEITVRYVHWDGSEKSWTPDPYRAGLAA